MVILFSETLPLCVDISQQNRLPICKNKYKTNPSSLAIFQLLQPKPPWMSRKPAPFLDIRCVVADKLLAFKPLLKPGMFAIR